MQTLNILGGGRVGRALGRLWHRAGVFRIHQVLNRTREKAATAVAFIGAGRPAATIDELDPADFFLIATPDHAVADTAARLAARGIVKAGTVVAHCSGALPAEVLEPCRHAGAAVTGPDA